MKTKLLCTTVVTLMLSAATLPSIAATNRIDLLGDATPPSAANRTITITPDTKYVNVTGGQIVKFNVGDKTFAWNFSGPETVFAFDLNQVAPAGVLDHVVTAYIDPNPLYRR